MRRLLFLLAFTSVLAAAPGPSPAVRRWMQSLSLRQKVAQLFFIAFHGAPANSRSGEYREFVRRVQATEVGGLVLVNWSDGRVIQRAEPFALAAFLNRMQRLARVPLLVGADFERGASMRVSGVTAFPHAMAYGAAGDPALTRFQGQVTAREARALGVHWIYHPVADVNNNPDNPIINIRSFGEDPGQVAAHVRAFIEGTRADIRYPVLTTAKHFPGHGDTAVDSHIGLPTICANRDRLQAIELAPFRAAIQAGVDSIMTAHLAVPALAPPEVPATLAPQILTGLLRQEMGFNGLIASDALEMGGIAKNFSAGEAALKALEAGVDALLITPDPEAALEAVLKAVRQGRLSPRRIDRSVERLLAAKERVGLLRRRLVDVEAIEDEVSTPEAEARAQETADRAVTLVRNQDARVPLRNPDRACYLVLAESRHAAGGLEFIGQVRKRVRGAAVRLLDPAMRPEETPDENCEQYVVAAYSTVAAYRGSTGLAETYGRLLEQLAGGPRPVTLVALGNPYLLRGFPKVASYLATFSNVPPSEIAAVKALFGEIDIRGRLPISIPGVAKAGDGIVVARAVPSSDR